MERRTIQFRYKPSKKRDHLITATLHEDGAVTFVDHLGGAYGEYFLKPALRPLWGKHNVIMHFEGKVYVRTTRAKFDGKTKHGPNKLQVTDTEDE